MKVLFILHFPPPVHGAALVGQYIKSSQVINQSIDSTFINLSTSTSVDDIGKSGFRKWGRYLNILAKVLYQRIFNRPDLVYITLTSHGLGLVKDVGIVLICRLLNLPHVYHFHNKGVKKYEKKRTGKFLYPFVFKKAQVILLSPLLYSDIEDYVPESRVYYCANGIPDMGFSDRQNSTSLEEPIQLLFLSNLIKSKGILDLLEACKSLRESTLNFHLTIAGGEGDISAKELDNLILENGLKASVSYVGKIQEEEKKLILKLADIFVFPTFYENECFPLVLLEAMQAGLPIVTTSEGAIPEIVLHETNGLIVPPNNPMVLKDAILSLCEDSEKRERMGKAGQKKFQEQYTLERFEHRFLQVMNEVSVANRR